jgi:hypothetical protein
MQDERDRVETRRDIVINNDGEDRSEDHSRPARMAVDIRPSNPTWGLITEAHRGRTKKHSKSSHITSHLGGQYSEAYYDNNASKTTGRFDEKSMVPRR